MFSPDVTKPLSLAHQLFKSIQAGIKLDITEYNATDYLTPWIETLCDGYIEVPMPPAILGHTLKDNLGTTVMVNANISDTNRKNFTKAHELGHILMHSDALSEHIPDTKSSITNYGNKQNGNQSMEFEANFFAANLLLPFNVLKFDVISGYCVTAIKYKSGVSAELIKWTIVDFLEITYEVHEYDALLIAQEFIHCFENRKVRQTKLFKIIDRAISLHPLSNSYSIDEARKKNFLLLPQIAVS